MVPKQALVSVQFYQSKYEKKKKQQLSVIKKMSECSPRYF